MIRLEAEHRRAAAIGAGGLAAILLLGYALSGEPEEPPLALTVPSPPVPVQSAPPPVPVAAVAIVPVATEGLKLHGISFGGAIIGLADGRQRVVAVGREVLPGLVLQGVGHDHALLKSAGGLFRLGFGIDGGPGTLQAVPSEQVQQTTVPPAAGNSADESVQYRLGMAPRRAGGRTTGFVLKPGANLPTLQRAGLRPGDVLVAVNGQSFDSEEKLTELPQEIAGSYTAVFEFERDGRRMSTSLEVNPRPSQ